jgi:hypothetical protein
MFEIKTSMVMFHFKLFARAEFKQLGLFGSQMQSDKQNQQ